MGGDTPEAKSPILSFASPAGDSVPPRDVEGIVLESRKGSEGARERVELDPDAGLAGFWEIEGARS